jgi:hypothetical protein
VRRLLDRLLRVHRLDAAQRRRGRPRLLPGRSRRRRRARWRHTHRGGRRAVWRVERKPQRASAPWYVPPPLSEGHSSGRTSGHPSTVTAPARRRAAQEAWYSLSRRLRPRGRSCWSAAVRPRGGGRGIRTPENGLGTVLAVFKTAAIGHSASPPTCGDVSRGSLRRGCCPRCAPQAPARGPEAYSFP